MSSDFHLDRKFSVGDYNDILALAGGSKPPPVNPSSRPSALHGSGFGSFNHLLWLVKNRFKVSSTLDRGCNFSWS